jgi:hypothetical protein
MFPHRRGPLSFIFPSAAHVSKAHWYYLHMEIRPVARETLRAPAVQRYGQAPPGERRGVNTRIR